MLNFEHNRRYSRSDVKELAGLSREAKGGPWDTGVVEVDREFLIFTNVGTGGRTGHDYGNRWEGDCLRWYHKSDSHLGWPSVEKLLESGRVVHIFWRSSNKASFAYAGTAKTAEVADTSPVEILWSFDPESTPDASVQSPEEMARSEYREGTVRKILVNIYERDRAARRACISHFGLTCAVCDLRFEERYGPLGRDFIHVHHLIPLNSISSSYQVNPIEDLRPVCPNCHAMLHRRRPPLSIEELRAALRC